VAAVLADSMVVVDSTEAAVFEAGTAKFFARDRLMEFAELRTHLSAVIQWLSCGALFFQ
jgi:hypothetical protein